MKNGRPRAVKGGAFERRIAKALSLWITEGQRDDVLWRSATSGAKRKGKRLRQPGDLFAQDPIAEPFVREWLIETKHRSDISLANFILRGTGRCGEWWRKLDAEAREDGRWPMLIVCQNALPTIVITRRHRLTHWHNPVASVNVGIDITLFDDLVSVPYS